MRFIRLPVFVAVFATSISAFAVEPVAYKDAVDVLKQLKWRFKPTQNVDADPQHTQYWTLIPHPDDPSIATTTGSFLGVGSYDDAYSFYLRKCGLDPTTVPTDNFPQQGKTELGSYIVDCPYETKYNRHTIVFRTNGADIITSLRRVPIEEFTTAYRIAVTVLLHVE